MTDAPSRLRIDPDRLRADLDAVNAIGTIPGLPGVNRPSFSDADMAGRRWLMARMAEAGLAARMDAVGNVIGRWETGSGPAVLAGSHLDTVPMGGRFDGTLGVCAALEAVRAMRDAGLSPRRPVEVIAFADEEGRFGGMLGSEAVCGLLTAERMAAAVDETGARLTDAMRAQGLDPDRFAEAARDPAAIAVFLELHIEQGPILAEAGETVGVVEGVSGVFHWVVTLRGEANHSGTTPMDARRDAFRGLAAFGASIDAILAEAGGPDTRLTVGKVALAPNFPHSIAGEAVFTIIGRDPDEAVMRRLAERCRVGIAAAAAAHGLAAAVEERSWLSPARLDAAVAEGLAQDAAASGLPWRRMVSGAGHDAQTMARRFPSGLIFAPSIGGVSHAPEEDTAWADVVAAAQIFARAVARRAGA
ncbi:MAG: Zn-dependent hydrolase [Rhodobacteraceae bacterium]|nr:MAG: Zn-dependent hydrolase [Paracoccaceae bacterium]